MYFICCQVEVSEVLEQSDVTFEDILSRRFGPAHEMATPMQPKAMDDQYHDDIDKETLKSNKVKRVHGVKMCIYA